MAEERLFECNSKQIDEKLVFVVMPFEKQLTNIFERIIRKTVESKNLTCKRSDDFRTNNAIMKDITEGICKARVVIVDITGYNPNVMYELGISHALKKEFIIIYQRKMNKMFGKVPFDISHIRSIRYINSASGGQEMKERLLETMEYVLGKPLPETSKKKDTTSINTKLENIIYAQHELRRSRIHYFTYHSLHNFIDFRKQHLALLQEIEEYIDTKTEKSMWRIRYKAQIQSDNATGYLIPFTINLLNNTANFIQSGWLVNKFPDEINLLADAMNYVRAKIDPNTSRSDLSSLKDAIEYRIQRISMYIEAMQEERIKVGLPSLEYENERLSSED